MGAPALKKIVQVSDFFEIRLKSVAPSVPLAFDIFLLVNGKPTLFRRQKESLTAERIRLLLSHGGEKFLVPEEQRPLYLNSLKTMVHDPSSSTEIRSTFIKESAFLHVHDLFTKPNVAETVQEAKGLVEEMVNFVTEDVGAVASLMRLSTHDYYTYNHCVDVAVYSIALAKRLYGDNKQNLIIAGLGGLLHDVGKRKIDVGIINKAGALTKDEWEEIKKHPQYGKEYLENIESIPDYSKLIVYEHHENFDGTGYPNKKKGDDISQLARICSIADVFDALTTDRAYHKAISPKEALDMMYGMQPGKFDPNIFKAFNKNFDTKSSLELAPDFDPCQADAIKKLIKK